MSDAEFVFAALALNTMIAVAAFYLAKCWEDDFPLVMIVGFSFFWWAATCPVWFSVLISVLR